MRVWLSWVICSVAGLACTETQLTPFPPPESTDELDMALADQGIDASDATAPVTVIGAACEGDASSCGATGLCLDGPYLATLGIDPEAISVPGGMCSQFCTQDADCGEGARCFNTQPFSGVPIKACLATCEVMTDCRWREGYGCLDPSTADEEDEGPSVCMPDSFIYEVYCAADAERCEPVMGGSDE